MKAPGSFQMFLGPLLCSRAQDENHCYTGRVNFFFISFIVWMSSSNSPVVSALACLPLGQSFEWRWSSFWPRWTTIWKFLDKAFECFWTSFECFWTAFECPWTSFWIKMFKSVCIILKLSHTEKCTFCYVHSTTFNNTFKLRHSEKCTFCYCTLMTNNIISNIK